MRNSVIISLVQHAIVVAIAASWVSFREVKFVPRQVYDVTLVTPAVAETATKKQAVTVQPSPPAPQPVEEEEDKEMPPPPERPKPKEPEKKPDTKEVPTTAIEKTTTPAGDSPSTAEGPTGPPSTGEMSFDTGDFPFAHYISRMRQKIAASWRVPTGAAGNERHCVVYFRVHRAGEVTSVTVEQTSGLFMFDQSCQRAVLGAAPLPPLPREYRDEYLGVHFSFVYRESP